MCRNPLSLVGAFNRNKQKKTADYNFVCCVQLGRAALHCAAAGGHADVVDTLLTAGAALELSDKVSRHLTSSHTVIVLWLYCKPFRYAINDCSREALDFVSSIPAI